MVQEVEARFGKGEQAETEMFEGIWLRPAVGSSETLVGTKDGVMRASTIERCSEEGKWSA